MEPNSVGIAERDVREMGNARDKYLRFIKQPTAEHAFIVKERDFLQSLHEISPDTIYDRLSDPNRPSETRELLKKAGRADLYDSLAWLFAHRNQELLDIIEQIGHRRLQESQKRSPDLEYASDLNAVKNICRAFMYDLGITEPANTKQLLEPVIEKTPEHFREIMSKDPKEYYAETFRREMLSIKNNWRQVKLVDKPVYKDGEETQEQFLEFSFTYADWRSVPTEQLAGDEVEIADSIQRLLRLTFQHDSNTFQDKKYYVSFGVQPKRLKEIYEWMDRRGLKPEALRSGLSKQKLLDQTKHKLNTLGIMSDALLEVEIDRINNTLLGNNHDLNRNSVIVKGDHGWSGRARVMDAGVAQAYQQICDSLATTTIVDRFSRFTKNNVFIVTSDNMGVYPHDEAKVAKNPYLSENGYLDFRNLKSYGGEKGTPRFTPTQYGETLTEQDMNLVFGMLGGSPEERNKIIEICWSFGGMAGIESAANVVEHAGDVARQRIGRDVLYLHEYLNDLNTIDFQTQQQMTPEMVDTIRQRIESKIAQLMELWGEVVPARHKLPLDGVLPDLRTVAFTPAFERTSTFLGKLPANASYKEIAHAVSSQSVLKTGNILHKARVTKIPGGNLFLGGIAQVFTGLRLLPPENSTIWKIGFDHAWNFAQPENNKPVELQVEGLLRYPGLSKNRLVALRADQLPMTVVYAADDRLLGFKDMGRAKKQNNLPCPALVFNNQSGHSVMASDEFREVFPYDIFALTEPQEWFAVAKSWRDIAGHQLATGGRDVIDLTPEELKIRFKYDQNLLMHQALTLLSGRERTRLAESLTAADQGIVDNPNRNTRALRERVNQVTNRLAVHMI